MHSASPQVRSRLYAQQIPERAASRERLMAARKHRTLRRNHRRRSAPRRRRASDGPLSTPDFVLSLSARAPPLRGGQADRTALNQVAKPTFVPCLHTRKPRFRYRREAPTTARASPLLPFCRHALSLSRRGFERAFTGLTAFLPEAQLFSRPVVALFKRSSRPELSVLKAPALRKRLRR